MKTIITTIALFISLLSLAQETKHTITVTVPNATSNKGKMVFALNSKETFMVAQPIVSTAVDIKEGIATVTFENIVTGEYAIIILHDLNGNQQMDFENGMPIENYGTSGLAGGFGPPNWADSKFTVDENLELSIRL